LQTLKPGDWGDPPVRIVLGWHAFPAGHGLVAGLQNWTYVPPFGLVPVHVGWQDTSA
jgi:hypothetical protein